jgi:hypothetical protein
MTARAGVTLISISASRSANPLPRPSFYFFKNLLGKVFSYFNAMVEPYNNWKNFNDAITDFVDECNI